MPKTLITSGAIGALLAVILGAFAAHGLKSTLGPYELGIWQTAVEYQMYHSLGLILIGLCAQAFNIRLSTPGWIMLGGIVLFSGSLYLLSLTGVRILGMITPLGGSCFMIAWGWFTLRVIKQRPA